MKHEFLRGNEVVTLEIERDGAGYRATLAGKTYRVTANSDGRGGWLLDVDGKRLTVWVADDGDTRWAGAGAAVVSLRRRDRRTRRAGGASGADTLEAAMPGLVRAVLVAEGDSVEKGQTLVLLEAMKMEIRIAAPHDGKVAKVLVKQGDVVERGQQLISLGEPS